MTADHVIVHDTRLAGEVFRHPRQHVIETHCEPIARIASRIRQASTTRATMSGSPGFVPSPVLSFLAHGLDVTTGPIDWAMQVGLEFIHRENAFEFARSFRGCVTDRIRVLACKAAHTEDGRATCRALASGAGVRVYASTTVQDFTTRSRAVTFGDTVVSPAHPRGGWIDFGPWEGTVMMFPANGGEGIVSFEGPAPAAHPPGGEGEDGGGAPIDAIDYSCD